MPKATLSPTVKVLTVKVPSDKGSTDKEPKVPTVKATSSDKEPKVPTDKGSTDKEPKAPTVKAPTSATWHQSHVCSYP